MLVIGNIIEINVFFFILDDVLGIVTNIMRIMVPWLIPLRIALIVVVVFVIVFPKSLDVHPRLHSLLQSLGSLNLRRTRWIAFSKNCRLFRNLKSHAGRMRINICHLSVS